MLINRASKQLKSTTLNKQIVIGKDPKQSKMEKHIICVKKKKINSHICQFCLNLLSNLYFLSSTLTHITYLFLNATEVLYRSARAMADKQLNSHQFFNYQRNSRDWVSSTSLCISYPFLCITL